LVAFGISNKNHIRIFIALLCLSIYLHTAVLFVCQPITGRMESKTNLYFVAIVLPEQVSRKVITVQQYIAERYQSVRSLRVVPHITLKAPFTVNQAMHADVRTSFSNLVVDSLKFELCLSDFGAFDNKKNPVIYIQPVASQELYALQEQVAVQFTSRFGQPVSMIEKRFSPHVTVAYRDLKPEQFRDAWQEFSQCKFTDKFTVDAFHLLQHDTRQWNITASYKLQ
jgi:2'-5' RNA ligase